MYAIVDIAGQQVKVEKGQKILVNRLKGEKGSKVDLERVLLINDNDKTAIGDPVIEGAQVQATILDHLKGDKVLVFKKKRRKGFKRLNGHRQYLSLLEIEEILEKAAKPKKQTGKATKKDVVKAEAEKVAEEKPAAKAQKEKAPAKEKPVAKTQKEKAPAKEKTEAKAKKEKAPAKEKTEAKAKKEKAPAKEKPVAKTAKKEDKTKAGSATADTQADEKEAKPKKSPGKKKNDEAEESPKA